MFGSFSIAVIYPGGSFISSSVDGDSEQDGGNVIVQPMPAISVLTSEDSPTILTKQQESTILTTKRM